MKIRIEQIRGLALVARGDSNHWVTMDGPEEFNGFMAGSRPMELLLMGVAGCAGMDVLSILRKKRVELDDFWMDVDGERAEEHPQVFTKITLKYFFVGNNIKPSDVERAISLTEEKYCGATAMLRNSVDIIHEYEITQRE